MRRVYPMLISKSLSKKDKPRAARLVYQALQQVRDSDNSPPAAPPGVPSSAVSFDARFDPVLSFMAELAAALAPDGSELALEVLAQLVAAANASPDAKGRPQIGFDTSVFRTLAPKDEALVKQAAHSVRSPVTRVLALAAFYQWEVGETMAARNPRGML